MIADQPDESPRRIELARIDTLSGDLPDLIAEVAASAEGLGRSLHPKTASNLADLVRLMNTYYSNLIEGHNTRPRDIERALGGARDEGQRDLQQEAVAHYHLQEHIDRQAASGKRHPPRPCRYGLYPRTTLAILQGCITRNADRPQWRSILHHNARRMAIGA
ncbi:hypothetical protein VVT58_10150 [Sphingobium sp. SJ10-10]|uniref:hypothetical protein n=1 Tax=Sphingobium sp. SJ10-10 TaxID=3114999 RepID=UPI002E17C15F|nr:hypothetical protein [Sphingobium sp. SJ10-10]